MRIYFYRILFSLLLLGSAACFFAQTTDVPAESDIILQTSETDLPLQGTTQSAQRNVSTISILFQLILSLGVVCILIYGVLQLIRRSRHFKAVDDPFLKNVASLPLAPNKTLYVITLINKAYLVGASDSSLSLIAEITDKELIDAMTLHASQTTVPKQDFTSFLYTFFPAAKPKATENNPFDSFLTKQRERLQNTGVHPEKNSTRKEGDEI